MSELKLPRLLAAAKEFNIGQDTLIEFLVKKGFPKDDLKPTAKLTEDQYYSLQAEFQSDKVARNKADHVELPKNAVADKDKVKKPVVAEPEAAKPAAKEVEKPKTVKAVEKEVEKPTTVKIDAPEVESPKVVDKIDLSLIDSSTRPKKTAKKTEEPAEKPAKETPAKKSAKKEEPAAKPVKETRAPVDHSISPENVHGKIENIATSYIRVSTKIYI